MVIFHSTLLVYQRVFVLFRIHLRLEINRGCRELCCVSSIHKECLLFETISLEIKSITHRISWWCCREIDITRYKLCKLNVPIQTPACFILAGTTSFFDPFDGWNCMFAAKKRHLLNHLNHVQLIQTHSNSRWKWWNHVKPIHFCWFFPPCYHLFLGEGLSALLFFCSSPCGTLKGQQDTDACVEILDRSNPYLASFVQCEAPKIAKLVYNSNNYCLWYL